MLMRPLRLVLLLLLGLVPAACGGVRVVAPQTPSSRPNLPPGGPSVLTVVPSSDFPGWNTYADAGMGYSITLPPGVNFHAGMSQAGIYTARVQFDLPDVAGYQGMVLRIEPNPGDRPLEAALARLYQAATLEQPPSDLATQVEAITVSGRSAVRAPGAEGDFVIVVPAAGQVYMLAPVHDLPAASVDPTALALFNQVLAGFRVTQ